MWTIFDIFNFVNQSILRFGFVGLIILIILIFILEFICLLLIYWLERLILQSSGGMCNSFNVQPIVDTCPILKIVKYYLNVNLYVGSLSEEAHSPIQQEDV